MFKKIVYTLLVFTLLSPNLVFAQESINPAFDAGLVVPDSVFTDIGTFGSASGIQQFLENKGSILAKTDSDFLAKLREPSDLILKTKLEDPNASLDRLRTPAELIYDASISANINPQVILVTLQKEQSLITKSFTTDTALQRALDRSLGYGCPDGSPCQANFLGFYFQLFGNVDSSGDRWIGAVRSLSKSFTEQRGPLIDSQNRAYGTDVKVRMAKSGDTVVFQNTLGGYAGVIEYQTVTIKNVATSALYRYTPHVFNGNYNFWRFFQEWFKYPNGTVISLQSSPDLWIIENGLKRKFSNFVATQRAINLTQKITVSPTEFASYIEGELLTPLVGTVFKSDADSATYYYINNDGLKYSLTLFTAEQYGINLATPVILPNSEVLSYKSGGVLIPKEGTLIKSKSGTTAFVISGVEKRPLTYDVFIARGYDFKNIVTLPDSEVDAIATGTLMPPPDGTLIRGESSGALYFLETGTKRWISLNVYLNKSLYKQKVVVLPDSFMTQIPDGLPLPPKDGTLVKLTGQDAIYYVSEGVKKSVTLSVFLQRELFRMPLLLLSQGEFDSLPTSDYAFPPLDGTLISAEGDSTIYVVENTQLKPLTYEAFVNRKYQWSKVVKFTLSDIALFEKGEPIIN